MYKRKSRLSISKKYKLIELFVAGSTARAAGEVAVFGLLKRRGKVYACTVPNAKTETLIPIIEEKVTPDSIVYTDTFRSYKALDISDFHHRRIDHSKLFSQKQNHIKATSGNLKYPL